MTLTKRCSKCGDVKAVELFPKNANRKDGLGGHCSECQRRNYSKNKGAYLEQQRRYRQKNKTVICERKRGDYQKNKEVVIQRVRRYRRENREVLKEVQRLYRQANREKIIERGRRYSKTEVFLERSRLRGRAKRTSLDDAYVKKLLKEDGVVSDKIGPELLELKKLQLKAKRTCRAINNLIKGNDHE